MHQEKEVPSGLMDIVCGFVQSKVMFVAQQMHIFDLLKETGPIPLEEVASKLPDPVTSPLDGLERLLNACVSLGFLTKSEGLYDNAAVATSFLTVDAENSWSGLVEEHDKVEYRLFGQLGFCTRHEKSAWDVVHQTGTNAMFPNTYRDKDHTKRFMKAMNATMAKEATGVVSAFDLSQYTTVVDLGGGSGALAVEACKKYPHMKVIVLELPMVLEIALEEFAGPPYITDPDVLSRISWVPGDFIEGAASIPDADLYILSHILHDWDEVVIKKILKMIFDKLKPGGALLVSEVLLNENLGPMIAHEMDLIMLVRGEGRERTFKEYHALLAGKGFVDIEWRGLFFNTHAILAIKP